MGNGGRRKWRVSIWKSEGVQVLGRSTRCHFFRSVFVWWCIERICLPAMSGSDPCGFLLSGSLFIFYTLFKPLLMSTSMRLGRFHLDLWDVRNQTEICVFVRHCCWNQTGPCDFTPVAWQACYLNCGKIIGMQGNVGLFLHKWCSLLTSQDMHNTSSESSEVQDHSKESSIQWAHTQSMYT